MRAILACVLCLHAPCLTAQQLEETLSVQQGGKEIGREQYTLRRSPAQAGQTTLIARAQYPPANPTRRFSATLDRGAASGITKFELEVQAPEGNLIILAAGSGTRLIVRSVTKGAEAGREMPGGRDIVLLDDNVFSLYTAVADLASSGGARLTAIFPRTGRRATIIARREPGDEGSLRIQLTGDIAGTLVTADGRIQRLDLPSAGVLVSRIVVK
jgi:hypothetical protein